MKFLVPVGGQVDAYGIMTSPGHKGVPAGIVSGKPWAADNEAFTKGFMPESYFPWLERMKPYRSSCLFVTMPDRVGDAVTTVRYFRHWHDSPYYMGWPLAFVAQDGQESLPLPDGFDVLFVGGTTAWKESVAAVSVIERAQKAGKRIHIGRVNWGRRYRLFRMLPGSEDWTCDGTRTRFDGVAKTLRAWGNMEASRSLFDAVTI